MTVRPSKPLQRARPNPQLAQALALREQQRPRTIHERAQEIHLRVELLRKQTYLLTLANRQFHFRF